MAVMAPEAVEAASAAAGRKKAASAAAGRAKARTPKPQKSPAQVAQERAARRERNAQIRAAERQTPQGPTVRAEQEQARRDRQRQQVTQRAQRAGRNLGQAAASASIPGDRSYQPVILAEFLIAVVLVAFTPIATGGSPNAKAKNSPSPYDTGDLRQLVAVGAVYFVLSLISSGNRGRISAWFGGLIVIGIAMTKMGSGQFSGLKQAFMGPQVVQANPANQQGWGTDPFGNPNPPGPGGGGHAEPQ